MIKGIIFDMDGVLVDNRDIHIEAFERFAHRFGVEITAEQVVPLFGKGNDEILPPLLPAHIIEEHGIEKLSDEKEVLYREIYAERIVPAPGLIELLDNLREAGFKIAVGSSGPTGNVNFVLEKCGIADKFDAIANGDMVRRGKPAPDVFLLAAELLSLPPQDCLVIEDSFAGIEAARSAGMKVVAMATTYPKEKIALTNPDLLIETFPELTIPVICNL